MTITVIMIHNDNNDVIITMTAMTIINSNK